jgi:hypothetical protein
MYVLIMMKRHENIFMNIKKDRKMFSYFSNLKQNLTPMHQTILLSRLDAPTRHLVVDIHLPHTVVLNALLHEQQ